MPIVVAIDRDESETALVKEGRRLADAFDEELRVVHAMNQSTFRELESESVDRTGKTISLDDVRKLSRDVAATAIDEAGVDATPVGLVGDPEDAIVTYAENQDASYLVIGGRTRSPVGKALFGSVTQSVLLGTHLPVVTVTAGNESDTETSSSTEDDAVDAGDDE